MLDITPSHLRALPSSRAEARRCGVDRFFTGVPCKHGHTAARYTSTTQCVRCQLEHARKNGGWNARPSREEYLRLAREIVDGRGGVLLSTEYLSAKAKLIVRCDRNHEFKRSYDELKQEKWCRECWREHSSKKQIAERGHSLEELRHFARREHGGDCLATSPANAHARVLWKCSNPQHEPFPAAISNVIHNGQWCRACWNERRRPPNPPRPREQVEQLVKWKGGEIITINGDGKWKGNKTSLTIRCARGHEWSATVGNLVHRDSWCSGGCQSRFGERITCAIFETTFRMDFPPARPLWMPVGPSRKHRLTLDGYNDQLKMAFEYQGPHHYDDPEVMKTDERKQLACDKHGVRLVVVKGTKKPFPPENVLAQIKEAFRLARIRKSPELPTYDLFEHELKQLRLLAEKKGGTCLADVFKGWDAQYEWKCSNSDHPSWTATRYQIDKVGTWCGHCAGNAPLDIEKLQTWGRTNGLELLDVEYHGANAKYRWRCSNADHVIERSRSNIKQSLDKGLPACTYCAGTSRIVTIDEVHTCVTSRGWKLLNKTYREAHTPLSLVCRYGHKFDRSWNRIQQGDGCRSKGCPDNRYFDKWVRGV